MSQTTLSPPPALPSLASPPDRQSDDTDLRRLNDLPVKVSAVVGRARMAIGELMKAGPGTIVELDRKAGAPVDILVNDRLVARGEIVLIDGQLGVTLTELLQEGA